MLLVGGVAASAATWPLVLDLGHRLPGSAYVGAYSHAWKYWWTAHALLDLHQNPAFSDLVNYPAGLAVGYYLASFLEAVWVLPVTRIFGPVAGVSVFTIGTLATAFWATTLLARWCGLGRVPGAFGALAWTFAPHYLGFLMGGSPENLPTPWIPLCLLACLVLVGLPGSGPPDRATAQWRTPARRVLLSAGVAITLLLQTLTTWFGGVMLGLVAGGVLLVGAWIRRRGDLRGVLALLAGLLAGTAMVAVSAKILLPSGSEPLDIQVLFPVSTPPEWLRMTWKRALPESVLYASNTLWLNHHLLVTLGLLALLGGLRRGGRFWLLASIPFFVEVACPETLLRHVRIPIGEEPTTIGVLLSTLALHFERRLGILHLVLALAAGHGLAWLLDAARRRGGRALAASAAFLAIGAWVAESALLGPVRLPVASFEVEASPHTDYLAAQGGGAVIDLPLLVERPGNGPRTPANDRIEAIIKATRSRYLFEQTRHGLPVLTAIGTRLPLEIEDLPIQDSMLSGLAVYAGTRQGRRLAIPSGWTPSRLAASGFQWIVLHKDPSEEAHAIQMEEALRRVLGEPVRFGSVLVFRIPDAAPAPPASGSAAGAD